MSLKIMLLLSLPGVAFLIYHAVSRRSSLGIGLLLGVSFVLCVSFVVGLSSGCEQAFCVNWNAGFDQALHR